MKFLILDTYYSGFLRSFWNSHPGLDKQPYVIQLKALTKSCFGTSDYYSYNLRKLGYTATDIIANDEISQRRWALEHKIWVSSNNFISKLQLLPLVHHFLGRPSWIQDIVLAQVKYYQPDVVYLQDLSILNPSTLKKIKQYGCFIVGQIACPLPTKNHLLPLDLILTSFPHYVTKFRRMGIKSEYFRIGFESRLVKIIEKHKRIYDVVFIGSFSPHHKEGTELLEEIASKIPLHVWGNGLEYLSPISPLRRHYHGEAWGADMYRILAQSKIVLNRHISVAKDYANNMRIYETTGMGAMLITDDKKNLSDLFKIGTELQTYKTVVELLQKIKYYLQHDDKRKTIAIAGQYRTLKDHIYQARMKELVTILQKYL